MFLKSNEQRCLPSHSIRIIHFIPGVLLFLTLTSCFHPEVKKEIPFDMSDITFNEHTLPVAILGGGISGLMAAVYLSQANIPCVIIEGPIPGGALSLAGSVRNWPGIIEAPGKKISQNLQKQVAASKVPIIKGDVISTDLTQWPRIIEIQESHNVSQKRTIRALSVIVAMGKEPSVLGVPGERGPEGYWGKGVGNCSTCEGSLYKDKIVAVIGGGDEAIHEALYLADIAQKVYLIVHKSELRTHDTQTKDTLFSHPHIEVLVNTDVQKIDGNKQVVTHINLYNNNTGKIWNQPVDGVILAIGSNPNTTTLTQLTLDKDGFVIIQKGQETNIPGVYAAGVIVSRDLAGGQAMNAASDGCKAALQAIKFLKKIGFARSTKET